MHFIHVSMENYYIAIIVSSTDNSNSANNEKMKSYDIPQKSTDSQEAWGNYKHKQSSEHVS